MPTIDRSASRTYLESSCTQSRIDHCRYSDLLHAFGEFIWEVDLDGVLLFITETFFEITGLSPSEVIGQPIENFTQTTFQTFKENYRLSQKDNTPFEGFDYAFQKADDDHIWLRIKAIPLLDTHGCMIGFRGIGRDVTDIHRREEELKKKDDLILLQSRQASMGELIGMIAHQWRQPITGIGMAVNNMLLDIDMELVDETKFENNLHLINDQIVFLNNTIDDFRNFFRPNKSRECGTVEESLDRTLRIIGKSLESNHIHIDKAYQALAVIPVYRNELIQVFLNLLKNAQDAFKEKQTHSPLITIKTAIRDSSVEIEITDNAGGIPQEAVPKIFEPYFSTKSAASGTGLGLHMSRIIIEEHHHGSISASNANDGACFRIHLPIEQGESL